VIQINPNIQCLFPEHFKLSGTKCREEYFDPREKVAGR
jgi:hypothetical protein